LTPSPNLSRRQITVDFPLRMTCDECKGLLSDFMDNELDESRAQVLRAHLIGCEPCGRVCEDLTSILDVCEAEGPSELVPPNSVAMWRRINNIIEHEPKPVPPRDEPRGRFWRLSFLQLSAALLCIAIVSSLLTVVAIKNYMRPPGDPASASTSNQSVFEKVLGKIGLVDTPQQARERRLKEQQAAIDYWNARVQARRDQWDRTTREAFDRNLQVIDESVHGYTMSLEQDPDDDLSGEMLDSVLNEKMNLLRDFSDL
jgi:Putative zinc-finger